MTTYPVLILNLKGKRRSGTDACNSKLLDGNLRHSTCAIPYKHALGQAEGSEFGRPDGSGPALPEGGCLVYTRRCQVGQPPPRIGELPVARNRLGEDPPNVTTVRVRNGAG
jgi:hypothetical protein